MLSTTYRHGASEDLMDWAWLDKMLETRPDFIKRMYGVFCREEPVRLTTIRTTAETGDFANLTKAAHTLKGASATVGAIKMRDAAYSLEQAARNEKNAETLNALDNLEDCLFETIAFMITIGDE